MSKLGTISGELNRERKLLRDLNNALLVIEATSLGKAKQFGYSEDEVENSKKLLLDFATRLKDVLEQEKISSELQPILQRIKSGMKPKEDWIEDLAAIEDRLSTKASAETDALRILEDVLSLLDIEFAEDLKRLYSR